MPLLRMQHLWAPRSALPYPFGEPGVSTWYNARAAIWQGLHALGIGPGSRIIAPAYSCGSEIDTLLQAGLELDYYRIGPDLTVDLDDLRRLCARPAAAIFVTYFYGLPQPMDAISHIARDHAMLLIEDASHGFFSADAHGKPLGSHGDMAVLSPWKSLPLPDCGVLRVSPGQASQRLPGAGETPGLASVAGRLRHMVEEGLSMRFPRTMRTVRRRITDPLVESLQRRISPVSSDGRAPLGGGEDTLPEAAHVAFRPERRNWRMSALSAYLLPRVCDANVVDLRNMHFRMIAERLAPGLAVTPLLHGLPPGCCPLFFPVVAREPRPFCRHLAANDVGFFRGWCVFHPHVDWDRFPLESHLKEHVVVLPLHQGLTGADMERIADVVNAWNARPVASAPGA